MVSTADEEYEWTETAVDSFDNRSHGDRELSHAYLDAHRSGRQRAQSASCLAGFDVFMCHIALWRGEQEGKWEIDRNDWLRKNVSVSVFGVTYSH